MMGRVDRGESSPDAPAMPLTKTDIVVAAIGLIVLLGLMGLTACDRDAFLYEPPPVHTNSAVTP